MAFSLGVFEHSVDYLDSVKPLADAYDVRVIMLITPETSDERIRLIDTHTDGLPIFG